MELSDLPAFHATLNGIAALFLVAGWVCIRQGRKTAHRNCMLAALGLSIAFLTSYLIYHAQVGAVGFQGQGPLRTVYFAILITHTILAATVPVLATLTVSRAFKARFAKHRAIARWTLPIWLYVSVTGVIIYWMLYHVDR